MIKNIVAFVCLAVGGAYVLFPGTFFTVSLLNALYSGDHIAGLKRLANKNSCFRNPFPRLAVPDDMAEIPV